MGFMDLLQNNKKIVVGIIVAVIIVLVVVFTTKEESSFSRMCGNHNCSACSVNRCSTLRSCKLKNNRCVRK